MENAKCYAPQILVGTEGLPREQWLEYRRKGIGGSDAAAVLGISPFRTGRDLYYDKLNIVTADDAENWVQLEVGTLLEPLVAKIFAHKTGYKIYRRPFMFQHPLYPWMLADLDYMVELPDGTTAILEIKTTNYNAKDNWWYNGEEIVPIYYESQGRHYMAVMNIDRVYFCCLYGNSEDEAIIRRIDRDMAYEEELIALERDFWENHVLTKTPPPYVEADGDLILESLRRKIGPADKDAPPVLLGQTQFGQLSMLLSLQEQKKALSADVNKLDKDIKRLKGMLIERMGTSCTAVYNGLAESYTIVPRILIVYSPCHKKTIWSILPPFAWRIFRCFCQVPSSPISFRVKSRSKAFLQLRRMKYISLLHYDLVDYPRKRRFISSAGSVPSCPSSIAYISSHRVSMSS